jgi:hypothetical protein
LQLNYFSDDANIIITDADIKYWDFSQVRGGGGQRVVLHSGLMRTLEGDAHPCETYNDDHLGIE